MSEKPKLRLVVRYPDGKEASYPLEPGRYEIGSGRECHIQIRQEQVARLHALLNVEEAGASMVNLDLQHPNLLMLGDTPMREMTRVAVHDPIRLGPISMELLPLLETEEKDIAQAPNGTVPLHPKVTRDLRMGISGYRRFQQRLASEISPAEAEAADNAFRKAKRVFRTVGLAWIAFYISKALIPANHLHGHAIAADLLFALAVLAALILVSWFHIPFAGRLVLPLVSILLLPPVTGPPAHGWGDDKWAMGILGIVAMVFGTGWLLDYGASTLSGQTNARRRRFCLLLFGLLWLSAIGIWDRVTARTGGAFFHWASSLAMCVCCCWRWWPGPWIVRFRPEHVADVAEVLAGSMNRWGRWALGKTVAIVCGVFPFFLFFNQLGFNERLHQFEQSGSVQSPEKNVWFWGIRGRLLQTNDFKTNELYVISEENLQTFREADPNNPAAKKLTQMLSAPRTHSGPLLSRLGDMFHLQSDNLPFNKPERDSLRGFFMNLPGARVDSCEQFLSIPASTNARRASWPKFVLLEAYTNRATLGAPVGTNLIVHGAVFERITKARRENRTTAQRISYFYLLCGIAGFIFLWRRGGDSWLAFWIGIWLVAWAASGFQWWSEHMAVPATQYRAWQTALTSEFGGVLYGGLQIPYAVNSLIQQLHSINIFFCTILALLCWPARKWQTSSAFKRQALNVARVAVVALALLLLDMLMWEILPNGRLDLLAMLGNTGSETWASLKQPTLQKYAAESLSWFVLIAIAYLLRRVTLRFAETLKSPLEIETLRAGAAWLCISAYLGFSVMRLGSPWFQNPLWGSDVLRWAGFGVALLSVLAALWLLVRQNFLGIAGVKDISSILLVVILPILGEWVEGLLSAKFGDSPFFSEEGANLLSIFCIVAIVQPVWMLVGKAVRRTTNPRLLRIEKVVQQSLEAEAEAETEADRRAQISRLFEQLKVERYAVYLRGRGGTFDLRISRMAETPAAHLKPSRYLREFFAGRRTFVDLERASLEWRYFFHQFELYRVEQATGCRYLLPICLGKSLRGLLMLGGPKEEVVCKDELAEEFGAVGVAVINTVEAPLRA